MDIDRKIELELKDYEEVDLDSEVQSKEKSRLLLKSKKENDQEE
ncbi:17558_t:CDS:1, partial [Gigaspora margarita]